MPAGVEAITDDCQFHKPGILNSRSRTWVTYCRMSIMRKIQRVRGTSTQSRTSLSNTRSEAAIPRSLQEVRDVFLGSNLEPPPLTAGKACTPLRYRDRFLTTFEVVKKLGFWLMSLPVDDQ